MKQMTNTELMTYVGPPDLLPNLDRQRVYLLRIAATRMPCAVCGEPVDQFTAFGISIDAYTFDGQTTGKVATCPECKSSLRLAVPFFGGAAYEWWTQQRYERSMKHRADVQARAAQEEVETEAAEPVVAAVAPSQVTNLSAAKRWPVKRGPGRPRKDAR